MRRFRIVVFAALLSSSTLAHAQPPAAPEGPAEQLAKIHRTLEKMVVLLEAQVEDRRLELIARRVELEQQRIEPLERRLRNAQAERDGLEQEKAELADRIRMWTAELDEGSTDLEPEDVERGMRELDLRLKAIDRRVGDLGLRISELENELGGAQRDLRDWRDLLDRALSQP